MKKFLCCVLLVSVVFGVFAKELEGKDLEAVNQVKNATLYAEDFDNLDDQLAYMDDVKSKIDADFDSISEEAQFLCNAIINQEKFELNDNMLKKQEEGQKSKTIKKERENNSKIFFEKQFAEFKEFESTHSELSACFYFHYKQAEMETADSLSFGKQMKMIKNMYKDFEEIEKMSPEYAENLYTYGLLLYMMPGFFGGNMQKGFEKISKAAGLAETNYDKFNVTLIFSQICFDAKLQEEWQTCMDVLDELVPGNKQVAEVRALNEAGKSAFDEI